MFGTIKRALNKLVNLVRPGRTPKVSRSTGDGYVDTVYGKQNIPRHMQDEIDAFYRKARRMVERVTRRNNMRVGGGARVKASGCNSCSPNDLTVLSRGTFLKLGPEGILCWLNNRPQSRL